jgi:hypothetical protein
MTKLSVLFMLMWLSTASAAEVPYTFETLDIAIPGQPPQLRIPIDINDQGRILTSIRTADGIGNQAVVTPASKAGIFRNQQQWSFISCNGPDTYGISLVGDVVVGMCVEGPTQALWKQYGFFKPLSGQLQLIDFPGADSTMATGRSADGKLVGNFAGPLNQNRGAMAYRFHCWTLINGQYRQIDYPAPNTFVSCDAINNKGQILMWYITLTDQNEYLEQGAVIYDNGTVMPLGLSFYHVGGPWIDFTDMNEDGALLGMRSNNDGTPTKVFLWDDGIFFDIKFPDGWQMISLGGMNNKEEFVGMYRIKTGAIDPVHGDPIYALHGFLAIPAPMKMVKAKK